MPKFDDDFKFPDENKSEEKLEITVEGDEDIEIKIVDDTPQEDRFAEPLPEEITQELEKADESEEYSKNVKTKFTQYKKAWHD